MKDSRFFLDSGVWLGYFLENIPASKEIVDSDENLLFTSIISIHEIFKKLRKLGNSEKKISSALKFIENNSIITNLNKEIALNAAKNCLEFKLHTVDSLIYSSSIAVKAFFMTTDSDFKKVPNSKVIL